MKKFLTISTILAAGLALSACDNMQSNPPSSGAAASGLTETQVQEIVAKYIDENPQALIDSLEKYQAQMMKKQQEAAKNAIKENRAAILESEFNAKFGELDSKNYVVEFFDYNCGFCKRVTPTVDKLIDEQDDLKIVFVEFPVLGASSELAAAAALVVQQKRPEKYREFHNAMMAHNGKKDLSSINQIARDLDIRDINFAEEVKNERIAQAIEANRVIADKLGIRGTPAFVINDELIPGAVPYEEIVKVLEETSAKE